MHPVLKSVGAFALYLIVWVPVLGLMLALVHVGGAASWSDTAAALAPASAVFAFICLSPWYIVRSRPMPGAFLPALAVTHLVSAAAGSGLLAGCAWAAAHLFGKPVPPLLAVFGSGVLIYLLSVGLHYSFLFSARAHEAERRAVEARALAREAELQALRFQLNPHFLFNSLHSISALATADGQRARQMCILLADFLRNSLKLGNLPDIPLREELALAASYLEVERVRFGDRLRFEEQIEPLCESCQVAPLLLLPLIENAVKHGVAGLLEGGTIRIAASRSGSDVAIAIENAFDPETPPRTGAGLGLEHVRKRLHARYGDAASLDAAAGEGRYRVVLRFPCESPIASSSRA